MSIEPIVSAFEIVGAREWCMQRPENWLEPLTHQLERAFIHQNVTPNFCDMQQHVYSLFLEFHFYFTLSVVTVSVLQERLGVLQW